MTNLFIAILMGSDSDLPTMEKTFSILNNLEIPFEAHILSAHRTPQATVEYVESAEKRGCKVFIAAAGLAAHLAGTVAAHTICPVIGIPMEAGSLGGLDALLSTAQMPGGIPVACTSIGKAGATNAAYLAAQILGTQDPELQKKLLEHRRLKQAELSEKDQKLQKKLQQKY